MSKGLQALESLRALHLCFTADPFFSPPSRLVDEAGSDVRN